MITDDAALDSRNETDDLAIVNLHESFEAFYSREFPRMVDLAYALSGSRLAAEDLAQDVMVAAHRQWGRIGSLDKPGAWTRRAVINGAVSLYRRRLVELRALSRLAPLRGPVLPKLDPEFEHIWREVRSLPTRQAQAVALFYLDQLSLAEIAQTLNCAVGTVKAHLHQARRTLAERLRSEGEGL